MREIRATLGNLAGFGLLDGAPIGVLANNPGVKGGVLFADTADKAARARERQLAVRAQTKERAAEPAAGAFQLPGDAGPVMACGGGTQQMTEPAE